MLRSNFLGHSVKSNNMDNSNHIPTIGELINFILFGGAFLSFIGLNIYYFICGLIYRDEDDTLD